MGRILERYIFREILKTQLVVLIVLLVVFLSQSLIRLVSRAAVGSIPAELITSLAMCAVPDIGAIMLPLTLFVAVLITVGRICSDSEMVVMRSVGFSPARVMGITLTLAFMTAALTLYSSVFLSPQAAQTRTELLSTAENNPQYLPIESGRFVSVGERFTVYIDDVSNGTGGDRSVSHIYVMEDPYSEVNAAVTVASSGSLSTDSDGVQWLHLENGERFEGSPERGSFRRASFKTFDAPLSSREAAQREANSMAATPTGELLASASLRDQVEAQWRIAPVLSVFVLVMIAVPLSMVNPRQGRFARLMPAILIYASYYMFIFSVRNLVNSGRFPLYPGLYIVPVVFLIFVAIPLNLPRYLVKDFLERRKGLSALPVTGPVGAADREDAQEERVTVTERRDGTVLRKDSSAVSQEVPPDEKLSEAVSGEASSDSTSADSLKERE